MHMLVTPGFHQIHRSAIQKRFCATKDTCLGCVKLNRADRNRQEVKQDQHEVSGQISKYNTLCSLPVIKTDEKLNHLTTQPTYPWQKHKNKWKTGVPIPVLGVPGVPIPVPGVLCVPIPVLDVPGVPILF